MKRVIGNAIQRLGKKNKIYHSEAELKFYLAWEIYKNSKVNNIYFEYPAKKLPRGNQYNDLID